MIMSAIFIETFFSACGACALADGANASLPSPGQVYLHEIDARVALAL